eukprot:MONOS_663.1-p1 / transcript=MONOS_663.1 / gene=MONOS_663 / organism=Monocercomonoides_exilis_PA203 / gene_product=Putative / transcript_product=Putative / location=Mono_scaffold00011:77887-78957(-) / protein_length=230 / sequence_SO=supercontig / SO=protein_coding / is_pseudo=false
MILKGLTESCPSEVIEEEKKLCSPSDPNYIYHPDPNGYRNGQTCTPAGQEVLEKSLHEIQTLLNKETLPKTPITFERLKEAEHVIKGSVMIAYPRGLPSYDPLKAMIDCTEDETESQNGKEVVDPSTAMLWFATRRLERGQTLKTAFSSACANERSKITVKLTKPTPHPPVREPAISEKEQKELMAFYFKKQREEEEMAKDTDDSYLASSWADPKGLKKSLTGQAPVAWK